MLESVFNKFKLDGQGLNAYALLLKDAILFIDALDTNVRKQNVKI